MAKCRLANTETAAGTLAIPTGTQNSHRREIYRLLTGGTFPATPRPAYLYRRGPRGNIGWPP
jgi:hypothetical protein